MKKFNDVLAALLGIAVGIVYLTNQAGYGDLTGAVGFAGLVLIPVGILQAVFVGNRFSGLLLILAGLAIMADYTDLVFVGLLSIALGIGRFALSVLFNRSNTASFSTAEPSTANTANVSGAGVVAAGVYYDDFNQDHLSEGLVETDIDSGDVDGSGLVLFATYDGSQSALSFDRIDDY